MLQAADPQIEQCSQCGTEITGQEGACLDYEAWGPCCCDVCLSIIPISSAIQEYFKIILRNIYADRNVFLFYFTAETHYSRRIDWMFEWSLALNNSFDCDLLYWTHQYNRESCSHKMQPRIRQTDSVY